MSVSILQQIGEAQKKKAVVDVRSGDTVKVTQKIKEGNKFRSQVFEGVVIRTDRKGSHTARITVRKVASGVGVEKSFLIHNPLVEKIEVTKRSKVRRKNLSYLRDRSGKSARLSGKDFDRTAVNTLPEEEVSTAAEEPQAEEPAKEEPVAKEEPQAEEPKAEEPAKEEPQAATPAEEEAPAKEDK